MQFNDIGPVQVLAIDFGTEAKFEGRVFEELEKLEEAGTIRLLDLLFVQKDAGSGELIALDYRSTELGGIVGALLGFDFDVPAPEAPETNGHTLTGVGVSKEDLENAAVNLEPGRAAGVLLIEHVWARDLKRAIREMGGVPITEGFLTPEAFREVAAEVLAMVEAIEEEAAA